MEAIKQVQKIKDNVRQYRDFLDVLAIATQQKLNILVPDRLPFLDVILDIKMNPKGTVLLVNNQYARKYSELRMYKGDFTNLGSLMTLKNLKISASGKLASVDYDYTICYTTSSLRSKQFESSAKYLAVAVFEDSNYLGTKVFMRENMIELISL